MNKNISKIGNSIIIDSEFLYDVYINKLMTLSEIAEALDNEVSYECVRKNLCRYGIIRNEEQVAQAKKIHQERIKQSNIQKYGVENVSQLDSVKQQKAQTCLERYGETTFFKTQKCREINSSPKSEEWRRQRTKYHTAEEKKEAEHQKQLRFSKKQSEIKKQDRLKKYGSLRHNADGYLEKERTTCMERYGVPYPCMRKECRVSSGNNSKPNIAFANLLIANNIEFDREVILEGFSYDFRVGNTLIEIDPTVTHNIDWSPFGNHCGIDFNYHRNKTEVAIRNGFSCIHLWDWDNCESVINLLLHREKIYARNCTIVDCVDSLQCKDFLQKYHTQSFTRGQPIRIGLQYNGELVSLMTFGKPRYRTDCDYELLRFCTVSGKTVVGGASKMFRYFLNKYHPNKVVSYCDLSKFNGSLYTALGFTLLKNNIPSIHWMNPNTNQHITDNLLRKNGYDRLFGTSFGKGTSNNNLMRSSGFFRVADCGQATYIYTSTG